MEARGVECLGSNDTREFPIMAVVDVSVFTEREQNLQGLVADVFRRTSFENMMTLMLRGVPESMNGSDMALSANLTRAIDNELLPLVRKPASTS